MLGFVNQAVKRMIHYRPDLFISSQIIPTTPNTVVQNLPADGYRMEHVYAIDGGNALPEASRETLDQMYPACRLEAPGTPVNWVRDPRRPTGYFLYPAPTSGINLDVEYVQIPADYLITDTINLPLAYITPLIDCTVFLAESVDTESIGNGRAQAFFNAFEQAMSAGLGTRTITDFESGAVGARAQPGSIQPQQQGRPQQ
jgi:hypothetical protein